MITLENLQDMFVSMKAERFGIESYDGMDVGPVDEEES